jgi:hypothetical protein
MFFGISAKNEAVNIQKAEEFTANILKHQYTF